MKEKNNTLKYSLVSLFGLPIRLIFERKIDSIPNFKNDDTKKVLGDYVYESSFQIMEDFITNSQNDAYIIQFFKNNLENITDDDIEMIYFYKIEEILDIIELIKPNKDMNLDDLYQLIIETKSVTYDNFIKLYDSYKEYPPISKTQNENDIKKFINDFTRTLTHTNQDDIFHHSYNHIKNKFNNWWNLSEDSIKNEIIKDVMIRKNIRSNLIKIEELEKLTEETDIDVGKIEIKEAEFYFKTKDSDGNDFVEEDGIEIFKNCRTSKYMPYIKYIDQNNKVWTNLYKGQRLEDQPNMESILSTTFEDNKPNTFIARMWLGDLRDVNPVFSKATKESFYNVVFRIDGENLLKVKTLVNNGYSEIAFNRVKLAFPSIFFPENGYENKIICDFSIYNCPFDEKTFYHLIQNEYPYNVFFIMDESNSQFAFKRNIQINYFEFMSNYVSKKSVQNCYFNINHRIAISNEIAKVYNHSDIYNIDVSEKSELITKKIESGTGVLSIKVLGADSRKYVIEFIRYLLLILNCYKKKILDIPNKDDVYDFYKNKLPSLNVKSNQNMLNEVSNSKILKEMAPEIFVNNYTRACGEKEQPVILSNEEAQNWIKDGKQVMAFPYKNPKYIFGCPTERYKYVSVRPNTQLGNKKEYPYIPCCAKVDNINPKSGNSAYLKYISGEYEDFVLAKVTTKMVKLPKILPPGKPSYLPNEETTKLIKSSGDTSLKDVLRLGTIFSPNSFIHCVCESVADPEYLKLNNEDKEIYTKNIRIYIAKNINISLFAQEMFDSSESEIMNMILDVDSFFDPLLFYRAFEEIYNINIFIYGSSLYEQENILFPRFKLFHASPFRQERKNVLVLRNWGTESNSLTYPQCEMIVNIDIENQLIYKTFGKLVGKTCYDSMMEYMTSFTFNHDSYIDKIMTYKNIYYKIDNLKLCRGKPVSQFIDFYGKLRALNLQLEDGEMISVYTLPGQPENLPRTTELYKVNYKKALEYFGDYPKYGVLNSDDKIEGLWFNILGIEQSLYIPIDPESKHKFENIYEGDRNYLKSEQPKIVFKLRKMKKYLNIIIQITRWLFALYKLKKTDFVSIEEFFENYTLYNTTKITDSSEFYNLDNIKYKLPKVESIEEALSILSKNTKNFVIEYQGEHKLLFYSEEFYQKMIENLTNYEKMKYALELSEEIDEEIPMYIKNYYTDSLDFDQTDNNMIFTNIEDFDEWVNNLNNNAKIYTKYYQIVNKLSKDYNTIIEPYIYKDENDKLYIIQNTYSGDIETAIKISKIWVQYRTNLGPDKDESDMELNDYIIYKLDKVGNLVIEKIVTNSDQEEVITDNMAQVFYYEEIEGKKKIRQYAAIFPLI